MEYEDQNGVVHIEYQLYYDKDAADADAIKEETVAVMQRFVHEKDLSEYASIIEDQESGVVRLVLTFPSRTEYKIATGYTGRTANSPKEHHYYKIYDIYDSERTSYLNEESLNKVRALREDPEAELPLEGCDFYYVYGTPFRSISSNGEVYEQDGLYFHKWKLHPEGGDRIVLRSYNLNYALIYGIVIFVFVLSLAVIFVIIYVNKRKQRKKDADRLRANPKLDEQDDSSSMQPKE